MPCLYSSKYNTARTNGTIISIAVFALFPYKKTFVLFSSPLPSPAGEGVRDE